MEHWQDWRTGEPKQLEDLWTLTKDSREASCVLVGHPIGMEVRVSVDGDLKRSQAFRSGDGAEALGLADEWRRQLQEKGWTGPGNGSG